MCKIAEIQKTDAHRTKQMLTTILNWLKQQLQDEQLQIVTNHRLNMSGLKNLGTCPKTQWVLLGKPIPKLCFQFYFTCSTNNEMFHYG